VLSCGTKTFEAKLAGGVRTKNRTSQEEHRTSQEEGRTSQEEGLAPAVTCIQQAAANPSSDLFYF
jgi:hypothetical protein